MKAFLKNYRQSPRKVRLVAGLIRGKDVNEALAELNFLAKRASDPVRKLLLSAVANAKQTGAEVENLFVKEIRVDKGVVMKRMMPAAMGTGHRINKRTSHILLVLAEKVAKEVKKIKKEAKVVKAKITKPAAKPAKAKAVKKTK
ncbi:MAG: 50S ribosomal protein L22 [Minisyncoccia bacterium]